MFLHTVEFLKCVEAGDGVVIWPVLLGSVSVSVSVLKVVLLLGCVLVAATELIFGIFCSVPSVYSVSFWMLIERFQGVGSHCLVQNRTRVYRRHSRRVGQ